MMTYFNPEEFLMTKRHVPSVLFLLAAAAACTPAAPPPPAKLSPDDFIALLSKTGAKVEKDGSFSTEPPSEMNMKLKVDGDDGFTATRFPSTDLARDSCQTQKACFAVSYWTMATFNADTHAAAWTKVRAAAGQPAAPPSSSAGAAR